MRCGRILGWLLTRCTKRRQRGPRQLRCAKTSFRLRCGLPPLAHYFIQNNCGSHGNVERRHIAEHRNGHQKITAFTHHLVHALPFRPEDDGAPIEPKMLQRVEKDCLTLCRALGYDLNTVEFAVQDGIPYAIDFLNPAPDADYFSVGAQNFDWIVNAVADLAIEKALGDENPAKEMRWAAFLKG